MKRLLTPLLTGALLLIAGVFVGQTGLFTFNGPSLPDFGSVEVTVTMPEEARIVAIEPISLDCRARVHAEVPVVGTREHEVGGYVYRTDRVTLHAVGDVDTCVDGRSAEITRNRDGSTDVVIPGESIVFVRPRVDMVATADSLTVSRGPIGKLTDAFPWVDDNLGLTPLAYAYAQNVIGSSECMRTAYTVTEQMLLDAYQDQYIDQGFDPNKLVVTIEGEPLFADADQLDLGPGVNLGVGDGPIACIASQDLGGVSNPTKV